MKRLFFFLCFVFSIGQVFSQVNNPYEKVKITYHNQQEVEGQILIMRPKDFFKPIQFVSSKGESSILRHENVESIVLTNTGQKYVSYQIMFKHIAGLIPKKVSNFYKVLVEGETTLYYSMDSLNNEYYIMKMGSEVFEFSRDKKTSMNMKGTYYNNNAVNPWKTNELISKCVPEDEVFMFSEHALSEKAMEYNECMNSPSRKAPKEKTTLFIGGLIGYTTSAVTFSDQNELSNPYGYKSSSQLKGYYDLSFLTSETLTQSSLLIGMSFSIYPRWNKHFSFEIQPSYTNRAWSSNTLQLDMESSYLELPTSMKINFGLKKSLQPFLGFGVNPAISLKSSYSSDPLTIAFDAEPFPGSGSFPQITKVEMPIILPGEYSPTQLRLTLSTGFDYFAGKSKIGLHYRYDFLGSLTESDIYNSHCTTNNIMLSIGFLSGK
jgi:Outer membrane protein beta-barrel domain